MELTAWQKICHRIIGKPIKKKARADKELSKTLEQAAIPLMPEVYLATNIVTSIAVFLACIGVIVIVFFPGIGVIALYESMPDPETETCLLYTSPSPRDRQKSRMPSSA